LRQTPKTASTTTYQPRSPTVVSRAYYNRPPRPTRGPQHQAAQQLPDHRSDPPRRRRGIRVVHRHRHPPPPPSKNLLSREDRKGHHRPLQGESSPRPAHQRSSRLLQQAHPPLRQPPRPKVLGRTRETSTNWRAYDRSLRTHAVAFLRVQAASRLEPRQPLYHPYRRPQPKKAASYRDPVRKPSRRPRPADLPPTKNKPPRIYRRQLQDQITDYRYQTSEPQDPVPAYEQEPLPVSNKETTKHRRQDLDDLAAAAFQQRRLNKYNSADAPLRLECVEEIKQKYPEWY
jgi:hypothetical protein